MSYLIYEPARCARGGPRPSAASWAHRRPCAGARNTVPARMHGKEPARMPMTTRRALVAAALLTLSAAPAALAQPGTAGAWPNQPIRLIVPFSAGTSDTLARLVATEMGKALGQPIVVENRPGAGGNIGSEACAKAKPDG